MKFSILKSVLQAKLAAVVAITEKKGTIPILAMVLMKIKEGEQTLEMIGTDLDNTLRVCTDNLTINKAGSACLSARKLFDIVRLLPEGEITIALKDNGWASVESGTFRAKVVGVAPEGFPEVPNAPQKSFSVPASVLRSLISSTSYAITQEESRYTLGGAKIKRDSEGLLFVTTDGHRLAYAMRRDLSASNGSTLDTLVPRKALEEVAKLAAGHDGDIEIGCSESNVRFGIGQSELISRLLHGAFPNYDMVIPKTHKRMVVLDTAPLIQTLKRVNVMADDRSHSSRFTLTEGELSITTQSPEEGEAVEAFPVDFKPSKEDGDDAFEIGFNVQYVLDTLASMGTEKIQFEFGTADQQAVIRPVGADPNLDALSVIMPMRI